MGIWQRVLFVQISLLISCASYQGRLTDVRRQMADGRTLEAITQLEPLANKESDDQLVYLFDFATSLQVAGDFSKSNRAFLLADKLAEAQDYHSISRQAGSMLFAEEMVQYKAEDYEKVFINAMVAVNFLVLGQHEEALVSARRINEKLTYLRNEGKKSYDQNTLAYYLMGLIFEYDKQWDNSYISYEKAYTQGLRIPYLQDDLIRLAERSRRPEAIKKWQNLFGRSVQPQWKDKRMGELALIFQQGWAPRKYPDPAFPRLPKLFPVQSTTVGAEVLIEGVATATSQPLTSVEEIAMKAFNDGYSDLVAKRMAAIATKEVVAHQVRQKNEGLGSLLGLAMHLSDRADVRQWSTLPGSFHISRVRLEPGTYSVKFKGIDSSGRPTGEETTPTQITIKPQHLTVMSWRAFR